MRRNTLPVLCAEAGCPNRTWVGGGVRSIGGAVAGSAPAGATGGPGPGSEPPICGLSRAAERVDKPPSQLTTSSRRHSAGPTTRRTFSPYADVMPMRRTIATQ